MQSIKWNDKEIIFDPVQGCELLKNDSYIAFDLETTGLSPFRDNIALIQMMGNVTKTPILIRALDGIIPTPVYDIFQADKTFVGHNVTAFDCIFLATHGIPWARSKWYDTLIGECIISTTGRRDVSKSLKESLRRRLGLTMDKSIEHGKWMSEQLSEAQIQYAVEDVLHLLDLRDVQINRAKEQGQLNALEMECELIPAVVMMTFNGLPLRKFILNQWLGEQNIVAKTAENELIDILGSKINLNSPSQLITACGGVGVYLPNTRADTLKDIAQYGEGLSKRISELLLLHRAPAQRIKMYNNKWQNLHIIDDWIHPRFWQAGTDTLRFSSSDPNIQQVPKDGRKIIGNIEKYRIVSADYSQIEVRIAASLAQDEVMLRILKEGDIHSGVASQIFVKNVEDVTSFERKKAKALTFALLFGGGPKAIYMYAKMLGSTLDMGECHQLYTHFFDSFIGLAKMRKRAFEMTENKRAVTITLANSAKRVLIGQKLTPQVILNTTVQGNAAIGMKQAIILAHQNGLTKYLGATVHDELVAAVPVDEVEDYKIELEKCMINGMKLIMPNMLIKVEVKDGDYWQS